MRIKQTVCLILLLALAAVGTAHPDGNTASNSYAVGEDAIESSVGFADLNEEWEYSKEINISKEWKGKLEWEGTHKVFSIQVNTRKLIEQGKLRDDCADLRLSWKQKIVPARVQAGDCGTKDAWIYFSNAREDRKLLFSPEKQVNQITMYYGNSDPGRRHQSVSPSNNNQATFVHPEGAIEMYYGTHQTTTYVNHDTHLHDEGVSGGEGYQTWHVDFQSTQYGDQPPDFISISDNDGNRATVSNPGDTYTIYGSDYSWIDEGEPISVYFEVWDVESSTVTNNWPITNSPPNQPTNPDPAQSTGTSPVYTTSPILNIDVSDPDGDEMDVTFYSGSSYDAGYNIFQWDHSETDGAGSLSELSLRMDEGSEVQSKDGETILNERIDCGDGEECNEFTSSDTYGTCITGYIYAPESGTYTFATDSDDASDFFVGVPSTAEDYCDSVQSGNLVTSWYGSHGDCNCWSYSGSIDLNQGYHTFIYRMSDRGGGDDLHLAWQKPSDSSFSYVPADRFHHSVGNQLGSDNNVNNGNTAQYEWTGLTEGQTYDWSAEACDPSGLCTTSDTFTFEVSEGPLPPDNPDPSDGETVSASSGDVTLSARYRHTDGTSAEPGTLTFYDQDGTQIDSCQADHNTRCSVTKNVNSGQRYDWYVVAEYNGQTATSSDWYFRTNTPPDQPTNPSPTDGASSINYNSVTLTADVNDPDGDNMDVTFSGNSPSDSFSKTDTVSGSGEAQVTVDNLAEGENYDWTVTAEDEYGASTTSDTWSFTTNYLPTIENPSPSDGAYISSDEIELSIDVSDLDGDMTNIRIYDDSGAQIGSGTTPDGSEVTVDADYTGLSYGNTYDWTVEAEDSYGTNSRTFSFSVIGGGSFRSTSGIEYEYSSIIKSSDQTSYIEYEVSNNNIADKQLETRLSGVDATFTQYSGDTHTYTLNGGSTKTFRIQIQEDQVGDHQLKVTTEDLELGVENTDTIPVMVRQYPASGVERVPGLMWIQVLFLVAGSTVLYSLLL